MADENKKNGATLGDAAVGTAAGAVVAASAGTIYGMTKLKNLDASKVLSQLAQDGTQHAEKAVATIQASIAASPIAGIKVDQEKLKAGLEGLAQKHGLDLERLEMQAQLLHDSVQTAREGVNLGRTNVGNAMEIAKELHDVVIGAMHVSGAPNLSSENTKKLLAGLVDAAKKGDVGVFADALHSVGIKVDKAAFAAVAEKIVHNPVLSEPAQLAKGLVAELGKQTGYPESTQVMEDGFKALGEAVTIPGKTSEQVQALFAQGPEAVTQEIKGMVKQTLEKSISGIKSEAKGFVAKVEDTGRKLIGGVKYQHANMMEKPFVAFEAMSTKGKVGLGMAVAATAALGTMISSKKHGSHVEAVQDTQASGTPARA